MLLYRSLLLLKFVGVLLYGGGLIAGFVPTALADRRRAVHGIASPGLVLTWIAGYLLTTRLLIPLTEAWILGGVVLSLVSQLALVHAVSLDRRTGSAVAATAVPLLGVLWLMIFRPTWSGLLS